MSRDTLRQSGMRPVELEAAPEKDRFATRVPDARARVLRVACRRPDPHAAAARTTASFQPEPERRGNSARALIARAWRARVPPLA